MKLGEVRVCHDGRSAATILVVQGDRALTDQVAHALGDAPARVESASTAEEAWDRLVTDPPAMVLLDDVLPDRGGLEFLRELRQFRPRLPVIFLTAPGQAHLAIPAMRLGAWDVLFKPLEAEQLAQRIDECCRPADAAPLVGASSAQPAPPSDGLGLVGECEAMQLVFKAVGRMARQDDPVLIRGERGTGKESVARAIHAHSARAAGPLEIVHCSALDPARLDAELFELDEDGRPAADHRAPGGTLVLQEIGDLDLASQGKLWGLVRHHGDPFIAPPATRAAAARIVATTSRDLGPDCQTGRFRADLYYLFASRIIELPPLRQRREDLPRLIHHLLTALGQREPALARASVSVAALKVLLDYDWPGNLDELLHVLRRALGERGGRAVITPALLKLAEPSLFTAPRGSRERSGAAAVVTNWSELVRQHLAEGSEGLYARSQLEMERHVLRLVIEHTLGNQAQAARLLGMTRSSLRKKLRALGMVAR